MVSVCVSVCVVCGGTCVGMFYGVCVCVCKYQRRQTRKMGRFMRVRTSGLSKRRRTFSERVSGEEFRQRLCRRCGKR